MNQKLLEQIALAKEAGSNKMAKDFFAKTPGAGGPPDDAQGGGGAIGATDPGDAAPDDAGGPPKPGILGGIRPNADASNAPVAPNPDDITPEQIEELLQLLSAHGGMQQGK